MRITKMRAAAVALLSLALLSASTGAAVAVSSSSTSTAPPVPGAQRFEGGWAVPTSTTAPAWFNKTVYDKVVAVGSEGLRLPEGATVPAAAATDLQPGIHPGLWLLTVLDQGYLYAWCTANFVFQKNGTYGLGTAGHCAGKDGIAPNGVVTAFVVPPPATGKLPGLYAIGKFVLAHNNGIGDDFAMISIDPQYNSWVRPTMPVWGGPSGVYRANTPAEVNWVGNGVGFGATGTARSGLAPFWYADGYGWYGPAMEGDSGSGGVGGAAPAPGGVRGGAGTLPHIVIPDPPLDSLPAMTAGTRMTKILSIARGWTLVNGSPIGVTAP